MNTPANTKRLALSMLALASTGIEIPDPADMLRRGSGGPTAAEAALKRKRKAKRKAARKARKVRRQP